MQNIPHYFSYIKFHQDGRVVKALDLSSNGRMSAWVRTPLLVIFRPSYKSERHAYDNMQSSKFLIGKHFEGYPADLLAIDIVLLLLKYQYRPI